MVSLRLLDVICVCLEGSTSVVFGFELLKVRFLLLELIGSLELLLVELFRFIVRSSAFCVVIKSCLVSQLWKIF